MLLICFFFASVKGKKYYVVYSYVFLYFVCVFVLLLLSFMCGKSTSRYQPRGAYSVVSSQLPDNYSGGVLQVVDYFQGRWLHNQLLLSSFVLNDYCFVKITKRKWKHSEEKNDQSSLAKWQENQAKRKLRCGNQSKKLLWWNQIWRVTQGKSKKKKKKISSREIYAKIMKTQDQSRKKESYHKSMKTQD